MYLDFEVINGNLHVQLRQNCYHFGDNKHQPIIADSVSKAAYYGRALRAFRKRNFGLNVQPLTCVTQLCPLHVHRHGFIARNHFITMNR